MIVRCRKASLYCAFVYKNLDDLKRKDSELDQEMRHKLELFRAKVADSRMIRYWGSRKPEIYSDSVTCARDEGQATDGLASKWFGEQQSNS